MLKVIGVLILTIVFTFFILWKSKDASPSSTLFEFKRIYETAKLASIRDPEKKADYYGTLLDERLNEMKMESNIYIQNNRILSTSNRYSATAGNLTNLIISHKLKDKIKSTEQKFAQQKKSLALLVNINKKDDQHLITDSMAYLTIYEKNLNDYK